MKLTGQEKAILKSQAFSWEKAKLQAKAHEVDRNITLAKVGLNKDFKKDHPDWVSQAQQNNFTDLEAKVRQQVEKEQEIYSTRWERLHASK